MPFAVKDNIDVAGLPTTAACPDYAYVPTRSAAAVERLEAAGAILIGKTNLDQFATGLVGVRSPFGTPRNPFDGAYIPGGSSSGSAVAVASGAVAFALGTDTAGSGRVPAGFNNLVGIKPTLGLVSTRGVVPACRSLDCVSVFALSVADGMHVLAAMAGTDRDDPYSRAAPAGFAPDRPLPPRQFDFAMPAAADLTFFGDREYERLFGEAVARLTSLGGRAREIAFAPFAAAAEILYSDAGVAERVAAVGDFLRDHPQSVLPVTRAIIERGRNATAADVYRARERLAALRAQAMASLEGTLCFLVPTAPTIYRIAEIEREPEALNARLGTYTNFVNLMDIVGDRGAERLYRAGPAFRRDADRARLPGADACRDCRGVRAGVGIAARRGGNRSARCRFSGDATGDIVGRRDADDRDMRAHGGRGRVRFAADDGVDHALMLGEGKGQPSQHGELPAPVRRKTAADRLRRLLERAVVAEAIDHLVELGVVARIALGIAAPDQFA